MLVISNDNDNAYSYPNAIYWDTEYDDNANFAALSTFSFPGIPMWLGIQQIIMSEDRNK